MKNANIEMKPNQTEPSAPAMREINLGSSKLARRLVPLFIALVAIPLAITVVIVGKIGQQQIIATVHAMEHIHTAAVNEAGQGFQQLGRDTVRRSSRDMAATSYKATQSLSQKWQANQASSLDATSRGFTQLAKGSFAGAMRHSVATNEEILDQVSRQTQTLFEKSARDTQHRAAGRIEAAMLAQIEDRMEEHAHQLAQVVNDYIQYNQNYLTLTAQMPELLGTDSAGQKAVLDALVRRYPMFMVVSVINSSGQETAMSASDHVVTADDLGNRSTARYFQAAMRGDMYIGIDGLPQGMGAPILRMSVPIELYRGKVVGVLAARLSLADLWDTMRERHIGVGEAVSIRDENGNSLLTPHLEVGSYLRRSADVSIVPWRLAVVQPQAEVVGAIQTLKAEIMQNTQQALAEMRRNIKASSQEASLKLHRDAKRLSDQTAVHVRTHTSQVLNHLAKTTALQTSAQLAQTQRAIQKQAHQAEQDNDHRMDAAAQSASDKLKARVAPLTTTALRHANDRLRFYALIILIASCLLSSVVALLLAGWIVRPIMRLAQGTTAIAEGDLNKRVDENAPAEIGDLAAAFNTMAESLERSRAELDGAEAQLVQSAKLASLGTLSAGVAHELNQPVAIIRGLAQQWKSEPNVEDDLREDLALIEGQTSRMNKIIKHLRTFCRAGGYELNEIDVDRVVRDCFILIDAQLRAHNVAVDLDLCDQERLVLGDANELEQVFINLITNARDAVEGRPDAHLQISSRIESEQYVIEFRDNGPGVPTEIAAKIFDPFFTTKEAGKGTGLGLSISHNIVKKHNGTIDLRNENGAVFTIRLALLRQESVTEDWQQAAA